ncbi:hypothetical protein KSW81_005501 [Nannochloris sp. 'desiccata']|nr:hypothetical protein KSW81_005501 [Chlorella desiccata (nom. nud.)]
MAPNRRGAAPAPQPIAIPAPPTDNGNAPPEPYDIASAGMITKAEVEARGRGTLGLWGATWLDAFSVLWGPGIAASVSVLATVWITGALHEDGLADTFDGFGGGWGKSQILRIMKDSRIGTYALVGMVVVLSMKFKCIETLLLLEQQHSFTKGGTISIDGDRESRMYTSPSAASFHSAGAVLLAVHSICR